MKKVRFISIIAALLSVWVSANAQNIIIGERVPEIKVDAWLADRQPIEAPLTYIEFFYSQSKACCESLANLQDIASELGSKLRVIIIVRESEKEVMDLLRPYATDNIFVAIDKSGKTFSAFGINYVPFGVLTHAKNRALWMGNSTKITAELIEQIYKQK